jgi:hypothetical protein
MDHDAIGTPAPTGRLPTEIEITPDMLAAGVNAMIEYDARFEAAEDAVLARVVCH